MNGLRLMTTAITVKYYNSPKYKHTHNTYTLSFSIHIIFKCLLHTMNLQNNQQAQYTTEQMTYTLISPVIAMEHMMKWIA